VLKQLHGLQVRWTESREVTTKIVYFNCRRDQDISFASGVVIGIEAGVYERTERDGYVSFELVKSSIPREFAPERSRRPNRHTPDPNLAQWTEDVEAKVAAICSRFLEIAEQVKALKDVGVKAVVQNRDGKLLQ
jgi:hypothetical protein